MHTNILKKIFVGAVLFLFISVSIAPSINFNVVKASNDNDFVEVTTQACGIKGYGNTTVKLTRRQYQNLEQYLVEFRARLNKTTTREEVVPLFKEAVVELNKYGLLPKGMSVERAQKLVTNGHQKIERLLKPYLSRDDRSDTVNSFCLVATHWTASYEINFLTIFFGLMFFFFFGFSMITQNFYNLSLCLLLSAFVCTALMELFFVIKIPVGFMTTIHRYGAAEVLSFFSVGLHGIQSNKSEVDGIGGFTGLKIYLNSSSALYKEPFYLGSALRIV